MSGPNHNQAEIRQTWLGRILCRNGLHLVVPTGGNEQSAWGGCLRCNAAWQWDNPHG